MSLFYLLLLFFDEFFRWNNFRWIFRWGFRWFTSGVLLSHLICEFVFAEAALPAVLWAAKAICFRFDHVLMCFPLSFESRGEQQKMKPTISADPFLDKRCYTDMGKSNQHEKCKTRKILHG